MALPCVCLLAVCAVCIISDMIMFMQIVWVMQLAGGRFAPA